MKIYLVGVAGHPNFGDELIMKNWVFWLRHQYPSAEIWLDVPNPTILTVMFKDYNVHITNALWRLTWSAPESLNIEDLYRYLEDKISYLGTPNIDISILNLRDIDIFHIVGGGYINEIWANNIGVLLSGLILKKNKCKLFITGNGFLPLKGNNVPILKSLLSQCDYCESRDRLGAEILDINYGYDDAYLMTANPTINAESSDIPDVMVCIQSDLNDKKIFDNLIDCVTQRLFEHQKENLTIGYVEAIPGGDRDAFERLIKKFPDLQFFNAAETILQGLPVKQSQIWYTTRFHHHLVASYYGCKGVALGIKDGYYDIKHQSIIDNGSGWGYKPTSDDLLPAPSFDAEWSKKLKIASKMKNILAESLYKKIDHK